MPEYIARAIVGWPAVGFFYQIDGQFVECIAIDVAWNFTFQAEDGNQIVRQYEQVRNLMEYKRNG